MTVGRSHDGIGHMTVGRSHDDGVGSEIVSKLSTQDI